MSAWKSLNRRIIRLVFDLIDMRTSINLQSFEEDLRRTGSSSRAEGLAPASQGVHLTKAQRVLLFGREDLWFKVSGKHNRKEGNGHCCDLHT